ncbi:hypothetical protein [Undibacterium sp. Tian12W]|uniref:hypothetical protein n=1 Tax=Undibacterium sp. Tian12W TaxID=3413054 RepID=UPI003BEF975E
MKYKKPALAAFIFVALLGLSAFFLFGREPVDPAKPQVFNADTAMLAIFGTYNEKQHGVLLPEKNTASWDIGQADTLATALLADTYTEAGKKKAVLVVQRQQVLGGVVEESHATAPVVSVYVFAYNGKQWLFEKGKKEVAAYGANGMAPMASLIRLGQDKFGLLFEGGDMHQGYTNDYAFIVSLSDVKPVIALELNMGESNNGACTDDVEEQGPLMQACWENTGKLSFLQNATDEYYTVKLSTTGNKPEGDKPPSAARQQDTYFVHTATTYKASKDQRLKKASPVAEELVKNAGEMKKQKPPVAVDASKPGV